MLQRQKFLRCEPVPGRHATPVPGGCFRSAVTYVWSLAIRLASLECVALVGVRKVCNSNVLVVVRSVDFFRAIFVGFVRVSPSFFRLNDPAGNVELNSKRTIFNACFS